MPTLRHEARVDGRNQAQIQAAALAVPLHHHVDMSRTSRDPRDMSKRN
jgi:hypothetical protein